MVVREKLFWGELSVDNFGVRRKRGAAARRARRRIADGCFDFIERFALRHELRSLRVRFRIR